MYKKNAKVLKWQKKFTTLLKNILFANMKKYLKSFN